jgi:hypothetical protein
LVVIFFVGDIVILVEDLGLLVVLGGRFFFCGLPELLEDRLVLFEQGVVQVVFIRNIVDRDKINWLDRL